MIIFVLAFGCKEKSQKELVYELQKKGKVNCEKLVKKEFKLFTKFLNEKKSIMLLQQKNISREISKEDFENKNLTPSMFAHYYQIEKSDWLNFEIYLLSDSLGNCMSQLKYYQKVKELFSIYEEIISNKKNKISLKKLETLNSKKILN